MNKKLIQQPHEYPKDPRWKLQIGKKETIEQILKVLRFISLDVMQGCTFSKFMEIFEFPLNLCVNRDIFGYI